jgi:hypothetical protein
MSAALGRSKGGDVTGQGEGVPGQHRWAALQRSLLVAGSLVGLGFLASACGGGSASPGVASLGSSTTLVANAAAGNSGGPITTSELKAQLAYTVCLRSHGEPNFPDPKATGGYSRNAMNGIDRNSTQFAAAQKACQSEAQAAGFVHTPADILQHVEQETAEDSCIRKHGVPNMPDPNSNGVQSFPPDIIPSTPVFQAAQKVCAYLNP